MILKTETRNSGNSILVSDESVQDSLRRILKHLLITGQVDSVFALRRTKQEGRFCYSLISDYELIDEVLPFYPVMPVQGAKALSELTTTETLQKPVAALLRPCEIRAFVENTKRSQGSLDNLFIISCTCPGVIPSSRLLMDDRETVLTEHSENIRNACRACTEFVPEAYADMTVVIASDTTPENCRIFLHTEKAGIIADGLSSFTPEAGVPLKETVADLLKVRQLNRENLLAETPAVKDGLDSLINLFSTCINCRGCREACPLCHCVLCDYETARTQHSPELIRAEAKRRGAIRVPSGTIQFQLGRLMHISPSCVSCGQCSDVCPVDIPVSDIFTRAAHLVQSALDYIPGKSLDDDPPMSTYIEHELQYITD
ncbi:MAG: coenzyme F420 hydrogenase [Candidatus Aegiribacteria sp.]|nr:coenzyme F420 hydrogenase [Candidatus Aegiribacteria sp.]